MGGKDKKYFCFFIEMGGEPACGGGGTAHLQIREEGSDQKPKSLSKLGRRLLGGRRCGERGFGCWKERGKKKKNNV